MHAKRSAKGNPVPFGCALWTLSIQDMHPVKTVRVFSCGNARMSFHLPPFVSLPIMHTRLFVLIIPQWGTYSGICCRFRALWGSVSFESESEKKKERVCMRERILRKTNQAISRPSTRSTIAVVDLSRFFTITSGYPSLLRNIASYVACCVEWKWIHKNNWRIANPDCATLLSAQ
jgi:hypothetical protein